MGRPGDVEIDETFIGGVKAGKPRRGAADKPFFEVLVGDLRHAVVGKIAADAENMNACWAVGIWERMNQGFLDDLGREFAFTPPSDHGLDSVDTIRAMHDDGLKVFVGLGGNLLAAAPDTTYTAEAMQRSRLTVQISTELNRGHLVTGDQALILPCLGRSERDRQPSGEQFVTIEDTLGVISSSRGKAEPASAALRSEVAIVSGMAAAVLRDTTTVEWAGLAADYSRIRQHIGNVVPGFEDLNRRIARDIFYLPNAAQKREFKTSSGRAQLSIVDIPDLGMEPDELLLTTVRSHDQFNTTIYGEDDRYRGVFGGRRVIFLNRGDIGRLALDDARFVDVTSFYDGHTRVMRRMQVVPHRIARRSAAMYFPEANILVPVGSVADQSNTPTSKSIRITLQPSC